MQIVIDISKDIYNDIVYHNLSLSKADELCRAVVNGTPLPKGHGRLIDADALIYSLGASDGDIYCKAVIEEDAPTIIEADGGGKNEVGYD